MGIYAFSSRIDRTIHGSLNGDIDSPCNDFGDIQKLPVVIFLKLRLPVVTLDHWCALTASVHASLHNGILAHRYLDGTGSQLRITSGIPESTVILGSQSPIVPMEDLVESSTAAAVYVLEDSSAVDRDLHFGAYRTYDSSESASVDVTDGSAFDLYGDVPGDGGSCSWRTPSIVSSAQEHGDPGIVLDPEANVLDIREETLTVGDSSAGDVLNHRIPGDLHIGCLGNLGSSSASASLDIPYLGDPREKNMR